ncbi:hypothetical protein V441_27395 [Pseudomonas aeruginosa DHS29]|nr:hypothetical protein EG09_25490 [Pseudomonas aeruginosa]AMA38968.1 hypothetical protein DPADHS01_23790 [Pseudomonas aeruginosa DHS01]ESZ80091.1 hypothetical protein V441_27395 [Pseudomonas aeruginosa DHS29]ETD52986.1 hypothetical protein X778_13165 [Pseudomonas aeruginosa VRFPA07]KUI81923.1 hypothetical protein ASV59_30565 [Pseudomonas aeruginosa 0C2E]OFM69722.1 hypothetical protein HMPREF2666_28365 [Pseudomonas sp. HMSC058C05]
MVQAPLKLLQVGRQAPTNVRIVPEFPPGDLSYFAYGSVAVVGGLAQQLHVVGVQLQGFCRGYRFVVEDVDVALYLPVEVVAQASAEAEPACQSKNRECLGYGFARGDLARLHAEIRAQLLVCRERGQPVVVDEQAEHLPAVPLQRGEAFIQQQAPRNGLMRVAAENDAGILLSQRFAALGSKPLLIQMGLEMSRGRIQQSRDGKARQPHGAVSPSD